MTQFQKRLIPTILCGGAGSRLWPVSRELHPKPFIRLADGQSLLQKVFLRALQLPDVEEILVVTQGELHFKTEDELLKVNPEHLPISFVLEPFGRNTAAAIAAASMQIAEEYGDEAIMLVLPSDHLIMNELAFKDAVSEAMELAGKGKLVTFGIQPTTPETGYGYIEAEGQKVIRFIEKPSIEKAEAYLTSDRYFWNAGMFCFKAGIMLKEMEEHCTEIFNTTKECIKHSQQVTTKGFSELALNAAFFEHVPSDSIDYAVMEKSAQVAVVPCDIGWSDIGSWVALGELTQPDEHGNRIQGEVLLRDTHNCIIQSDNCLVGALGVYNLIIIHTQDAILVADKDRVQEVRHLYIQLKKQDHHAHKFHHTTYHPWGTSILVEESEGIRITRFEIKQGASVNIPKDACEGGHCIILSGVAKISGEVEESQLQANETFYFSSTMQYQIQNLGETPLAIIEILKLNGIAS